MNSNAPKSLVIFLCALTTLVAFATKSVLAAPRAIDLSQTNKVLTNITRDLEVLNDDEGRLTREQVTSGAYDDQFRKADFESLTHLKGIQWLRGVIDNKSGETRVALFQFDLGSHINLDFYAPGRKDPTSMETGWKTAFSTHELPFLHPTLELVIPPGTSHFLIKNDGSLFSLSTGSKATIGRLANQLELWFVFSVGTFLSLGVFNLFLYFRTLDQGYLHYSVRCVLVMIMGGITFNTISKYITPDAVMSRLQWMATFACINSLSWFIITRHFLSLDRFVNKLFLNISFYLLGFGLLAASLYGWFFPNLDPFVPVSIASAFAYLWMLVMGIFMCFHKHRPAYFYLPATGVYFFGVFTVIFAVNGVIPATTMAYLAPSLCGAIEALLMSFGLGDQYMMAMKAANAALHKEVSDLGRDLSFMQQKLNQGIFSIDQQGRIGEEHSEYLKVILDDGKVAGKDAFSTIFDSSDLSKDKKEQIKQAVLLGIGEDSIFYDMNSHILPREIVRRIHGNNQILEVDWQPLLDPDDRCDKMMVVLRDVSDLRALQAETAANHRNLLIIGQVLSVSLPNYEKFSKNAAALLKQNIEEIEKYRQSAYLDVELLFRNVHTIKGNSRTFGLLFISDTAHEVENYLSELKLGRHKVPDAPRLLADTALLAAIQDEYSSVVSVHLNAGGNESQVDLVERLNSLYEQFSNEAEVKERFFKMAVQERIDRYFPTLDEILSPIIRSQSKTADELAKLTPNIVFEGETIRLNVEMETILRNIFTQILRNSIDHGIETPEERKRAGKELNGMITITIEASVNGEDLTIVVFDDGAGLNMDALARKSGGGTRSDEDIANSIFKAGISTAESITHISGRGIGMDIIQDQVVKLGGSIAIAFTKQKSESGRQPFKLILTFPSTCVLMNDKRKLNILQASA